MLYRLFCSNFSELSEIFVNDDLCGEVGSERSVSSKFIILLIGDFMVKDIYGKKLVKVVGYWVVVKLFFGVIIKVMRDYLKFNLEF